MKRVYKVLFESETAKKKGMDLAVSQQEAAAIKSLADMMENPAFSGDAEGVFNYLCGFGWFKEFHGLAAGNSVRFRLGRRVYRPREEHQDDEIVHVWTLEYVLNGEEWLLTLVIEAKGGHDVNITVKE